MAKRNKQLDKAIARLAKHAREYGQSYGSDNIADKFAREAAGDIKGLFVELQAECDVWAADAKARARQLDNGEVIRREKVRELLIEGIGEGYLWDRSSFEREAKRGAFDNAAKRIADSLLAELNK